MDMIWLHNVVIVNEIKMVCEKDKLFECYWEIRDRVATTGVPPKYRSFANPTYQYREMAKLDGIFSFESIDRNRNC
jgi:hypothetical protein